MSLNIKTDSVNRQCGTETHTLENSVTFSLLPGRTQIHAAMDLSTAISIAGNIIQFVDYSVKMISETTELHGKDQLSERQETQKAVEDLSKFSREMSSST